MVNVRKSNDEIASRRGVRIREEVINADLPANSSQEIVHAIEQSCSELGLRSRRMVSRAYHDSSFMAQLAPIAMIFIPCRAGVSHRPDEFAKREDIVAGVRVLATTLARLASR